MRYGVKFRDCSRATHPTATVALLLKIGISSVHTDYREPDSDCLNGITTDFDDKSIRIVKVNAASCRASDGAAVDRNLI